MNPDDITNKVFSLVRRGYDPEEVDTFLETVATALGQAQAGIGAEPQPAADPVPEVTITGPDDFGRLGDEIAAILRQAHESVDKLRHGAEADAALIRQTAQREVDALKSDADRDRQQAAVELEAARQEADRMVAEAEAASNAIVEQTAERARARAQEVIDQAKVDARGAVTVQRNVRGRLEDTREHIDQAMDRLVREDTELFGTIDLTDSTMDQGEGPGLSVGTEPVDVPPPGQGPPSPPVPPPTRAGGPSFYEDLPYAEGPDEPIDLRDAVDPDDVAGEEPPGGDDGANPLPEPPPEPPPSDGPTGAAQPVPEPPAADDGEEDALAQMVKNAVENALRRRKGDEPTDTNGV